MDEKIQNLIRWITLNNEAEPGSIWLYPRDYSHWHIHTEPLLTAISEIFGIPETEIGDEVERINIAQASKERK